MNGALAWSNLPDILAERNLSVSELQRKLEEKGFSFNIKTLYRLAGQRPLRRLDLSVIYGLVRTLDLQGLDQLITLEKPKAVFKRLPEDKQRLLDELLDKNNAGTLSRVERKKLVELVSLSQKISLYNAKILTFEKKKLR